MKKKPDQIWRIALRSFVLILMMQAGAYTALYAETFTSSPISIDISNETVQKAMETLQKNNGYSFSVKSDEVDLGRVINVTARDANIDTVLGEIFRGQNVSWTVEGNSISVASIRRNAASPEQNRVTISGKVTDAGKSPMIGVSVVVLNTTTGVTTGYDGSYQIVADRGATIEFQSLGYKTQSFVVETSRTLDVAMEETATEIDQVVVTALGIRRQAKALGYVVTEVSADELTNVKETNFINSLAGKVAGLTINSSAAGIGGAAKVVLRGTKSITHDNNVLYVVDGIPISNRSGSGDDQISGSMSNVPYGEGISDINPEDIESVSVLNGPSAAALYGSRAANGAIVINTKRGVAGTPKITYSHSSDFSSPFIMPQFQNTYGNVSGYYESWGEKLAEPTSYDPKKFFRTGTNITNNVSVSFGSDKSQTYVSAGSTNAKGIIPNNKYNRYNFTARNSTSMLNDRLVFDFNVSYIRQDDQNMMVQGQYFNPLVPLYLFPRGDNFDAVKMYQYYDETAEVPLQNWQYGTQGYGMQNPYWIVNKNLFTNKKDRYMAGAKATLKILDWLSVSGRINMDHYVNVYEKKLHAGTDGLYADKKGAYEYTTQKSNQLYGDVLLNANKRFGDWGIDAYVGGSFDNTKYVAHGQHGQLLWYANKFVLKNHDKTGGSYRTTEDLEHTTTQSVFASAEVNYKSYLYLTLTGRNDWFSQMAYTNSVGDFYPSVSLSAIISEMANLPDWFSFLKVRGSWSNVSIPPPYGITYPVAEWGNYLGDPASTDIWGLSNLKVERTKSYEAGLTMKFWGNRLGLDMTLYHSNTTNQTILVNSSASGGYKRFYIQSGDVRNKGLEMTLSGDNKFGDFRWNSSFTLTMNRNKILSLAKNVWDPITGKHIGDVNELTKITEGSYWVRLTEGGSMGDFYTTTRLREDGNGYIYVNPNTLAVSSESYTQYAGNVNPKANLGFRNHFSYKGVDLGFLFSARIGGEVVSATQALMDQFGASEVTAKARDDGGVMVNSGRVDAENYYKTVSSMYAYYIYSATNVRLQELTLGYTLPSKWFNDKLDIKVSFVGKNLWMIYNKAPFDPEVTASTGTYFQGFDYFMHPSTRNLGFSVRINF